MLSRKQEAKAWRKAMERLCWFMVLCLAGVAVVSGCGPEEQNNTPPVVIIGGDAGGGGGGGGSDGDNDAGDGDDANLDDTGTDPSQCPVNCSLGLTTCDGNGVRTCIADGDCNIWSDVVACASGEVCSGGSCGDTCQDICVAGARECAGASYRVCETNASGCADWSQPTSCPQGTVCSGGQCLESCTDVCTAGQTRCSGGQALETCEEQVSGCLDWSAATACPDGGVCDAGQCLGCTDGAERCATSGHIEQCQAGAWHTVQACAFGCQGTECLTSVTCTPGEYRCNANQVEVCNAGGSSYLHISTCAVACANGLCTGSCDPGERRCNGDSVEECNGTGTGWDVVSTCTTLCDPTSAQCALESLNVTTNTTMNGLVVVDGPVTVRAGATLSSTEGDLTIRAHSITVELGGSISVAPTGTTATGQGIDGGRCSTGGVTRDHGGGGGSYGTRGTFNGSSSCTGTRAAHGTNNDVVIVPGSPGGKGYRDWGGEGGLGGGVIKLYAETINIAGQVTANGQNGGGVPGGFTSGGGGGGGSGGGVLIAADQLTLTGSVMTEGGVGGLGYGSNLAGGDGGQGRIKLYHGVSSNVTGTLVGASVETLLPPMTLTSSTHPSQELYYNDDFDVIALSWERAFPAVQGYYHVMDRTMLRVPTPANGAFTSDELVSFPRSAVLNGTNYFHIVSVDGSSNLGTSENRYRLRINTSPPTVTSTSHPSQTQWSTNNTIFFQWTLPHGDENFAGYYYVLDQYGDTVPTKADTFLSSVSQKQLIRQNIPDGIWAFHIVSVDTHGYLTRQAGRYVVRLGEDPGLGGILGTVTDSQGTFVAEATVTINRGLLTPWVPNQSTSQSGSYNFLTTVPAGSWEVQVSAPGFETKVQQVSVAPGEATTANFTLTAL